MKPAVLIAIIGFAFCACLYAQSGRVPGYSESPGRSDSPKTAPPNELTRTPIPKDIVRIETDLITVPVRVRDPKGRSVSDIQKNEFKIFENGVEQEISYFSNENQPFTVALVLDMSYSTVFKLADIQAAANQFVAQLRDKDKVFIVSFDEKPQILCEPTGDRRVLRLAIEGSKTGSGTSLYDTLGLVVGDKFNRISGRKAVVLLTDGVDTSSSLKANDILSSLGGKDILVYPAYDTYDDVQKSRRKNAKVLFDENDRPYVTDPTPEKGEREADYDEARSFLKGMAAESGARVYPVSSKTNLNRAFASIAEELRKTYSLGYYPHGERKLGARYLLKVRIYRPNLIVEARDSYIGSAGK